MDGRPRSTCGPKLGPSPAPEDLLAQERTWIPALHRRLLTHHSCPVSISHLWCLLEKYFAINASVAPNFQKILQSPVRFLIYSSPQPHLARCVGSVLYRRGSGGFVRLRGPHSTTQGD